MFRASQGFQRTFRMYERREALVGGGEWASERSAYLRPTKKETHRNTFSFPASWEDFL